MDQLIFASLSHNHFLNEVDMLKLPAVSCNPPIAMIETLFETILIIIIRFGGWAAYQTVFSVACNLNSEILAARTGMFPHKNIK